MSHSLENVKVSRDESAWEVEVKAEIPAAALAKYRDEALSEMQKTAQLDGFRPGKAPVERIVQVYGESAVMKRAAERAVQHELPEVLAAQSLMIIESPRVTLDNPEVGKSLLFTARAALAPQITLPDYKSIATSHKKEDEISISDAEYADALLHLRKERARIDKVERGVEPKNAHEEAQKMEEKDLPALDDDFCKTIGYESAKHFEDTLRLNMKEEKTRQQMEKRRTAILDELVEKSTIFYPSILREYELDDMESRMKDDLARMGTNYEAYLNQTKKTPEQVRSDWLGAADKRTKVRLLLTEIARKENIEPDPAAIDHELDHAKKHYPQADGNALRAHIQHAMRNEATLKFLESQA